MRAIDRITQVVARWRSAALAERGVEIVHASVVENLDRALCSSTKEHGFRHHLRAGEPRERLILVEENHHRVCKAVIPRVCCNEREIFRRVRMHSVETDAAISRTLRERANFWRECV